MIIITTITPLIFPPLPLVLPLQEPCREILPFLVVLIHNLPHIPRMSAQFLPRPQMTAVDLRDQGFAMAS